MVMYGISEFCYLEFFVWWLNWKIYFFEAFRVTFERFLFQFIGFVKLYAVWDLRGLAGFEIFMWYNSFKERNMGENFWANEEDMAMVEWVLGSGACEFLIKSAANSAMADLVTPHSDLGVQQAQCLVVEGSNWNYAIQWHASNLKSGGSALIWRDWPLLWPKGWRSWRREILWD